MKEPNHRQLSLLSLLEQLPAGERLAPQTVGRPERRRPPKPSDSSSQISFADRAYDPGWALARPRRRKVVAPSLSPEVRQQARRFEHQAAALGVLTRESAHTERKALECVAKQAQRLLGRDFVDLAELYDVGVIAAIAVDDQPFDQETVQLGRPTMRQRRGVLGQYLRVMGVPGLTYEQGMELIKTAFRLPSTRRGYRYVLGKGRLEQRDGYRPPVEDVQRFFLAAKSYGLWFSGQRLAAVAALSLYHGLRPVSVLNIRCQDFRWKRDRVFLTIKEKRVKGKRELREIELRPRVLRFLRAYEAVVNRTAARRGWQVHLTIGDGEGPFFLDQRAHALNYATLLRDFGACSRLAGIQPFTAYGLRRLHASGLAALLPMGAAAMAGGWLNEGVFGRHYARSLGDWQPQLLVTEPETSLDDDFPPALSVSSEHMEVNIGHA